MLNLADFQERIWADLSLNVPETAVALRAAMAYALEGGKRWRPIIFLAMCETSPFGVNVHTYPCLWKVCLFLEYVHTASLIFDDMPMMDDDDVRRGKVTLHKMYDEATCKLAALQLLLLAQKHLCDTLLALEATKTYFKNPQEWVALYAMCNCDTYRYLGSAGLCVGQFMDLQPQTKTDKHYMQMIHHKTSALFILAFKLGYILAHKIFATNSTTMEQIEHIGTNFGYLYQILDDVEDYEQDFKAGGKKHNNNYFCFFPKDTSIIPLVHKLFQEMVTQLNALHLGCVTVHHIMSQIRHKWLKSKTIIKQIIEL